MKVVVTGATGFVGKVIVKKLLEAGDEVIVLTRNVAKAAITLGSSCKYFQWENTNQLPPAAAFEGVDGVINLLGETISQRWTEETKKLIYDSRIVGTRNLISTMKSVSHPPKVLVSTSAIGIYGDRGDEEINENSNPADDFLGKLCQDWEAEANAAAEFGTRVVNVRVGIVLGKGGGALARMLPIFKLGGGGRLGSGEQFMSWIHIEDLASMYIEALKNNSIQGPVNGTSPYPTRNLEFTKVLSKTLHRPAFMPAPKFAIKLAFGEMSQILLGGQKVLPKKFADQKFRYRYPTLEIALKDTAF